MQTTAAHRFHHLLGMIALAGLVLRLAIRLVVGTGAYWTDGYGQYAELAQSLCAGHGYAFAGAGPTAFRVPLYPMLVAATTCGAGSPWPLILAQALASSGTALIAGLIARQMAGPGAGLAAAAIYAAWPYVAWHDLSLQESGVTAFLAALATWALMRAREHGGGRWPAMAGLLLGLALLTRATLLPFALCATVIVALPRSGRPRWRTAGLVAAVMLATLSPWLTYAHRVTGHYNLGTEGGAALYAGNHALTFSAFPQRSIDESRANVFASLTPSERAERDRLGRDEVAQSDWYRNKALRTIAADPLAFASGALRKLWAAFRPMPVPLHGTLGNWGYAAFWVPMIALALTGMWLRRRTWREDLLLHAHVATFCAVTALFWAQTAHRSYLDPYLAAFAGVALASLVARARLCNGPTQIDKTQG